MTADQVVAHLGLWSLLGCAIFTVFVILVFRSGAVWETRGRDGKLKPEMSIGYRLFMLVVPLGLIGLQIASNACGLAAKGYELGFWQLYVLNLGYYLILILYDTLVIDYLVIVVLRPAFLGLPEEMDAQSMREHMLMTIPVGTLFGVILTAISTAVSHFALMN